MVAKIRKGDSVTVRTGKDAGRQGTVSSVDPKRRRAVVSGINVAIRHEKASAEGQGGRLSREMPIDLSNLMLVDPESGKPTRAGFRMEEGRKIRYAKRSGAQLDG